MLTTGKVAMTAAVTLFALTACSSSTADTEPEVDWSNYSQGDQETIDDLADKKDCQGLQEQFDFRADSDDAQRKMTGEGNGALLDYIDAKLRAAGCHDG